MDASKTTGYARSIPSESDVISRILAGDRELYYELISPYERLVYLSAFSVLRNEADAEDCAQNAFLKAFQKLGEFKGESKFSSWLVRIVSNEAKMRLRKFRLERSESLENSLNAADDHYEPQYLGDWREIPSEALERKEAKELLENALKSLPDIYREVFVLRDIESLNVSTTAQVLGVSDGVVKTRLLRARMQLRDLLAPAMKNGEVLSRQSFRKGKNPWR
jgi:RNA polymerase sigma-70 factor (ECF subfamily)